MSGVPGTYKNGKQTPGGIVLPSPDPLQREHGTIAVLTNERGTYAQFWNDLMNTVLLMMGHHPKNRWKMGMGVDICGQLNSIIRGLEDDDWLWIMGDDHAFDYDLLPRLLAHDVDVVVPHCFRRNPPWQPVVNSHEIVDEDGVTWQVSAELPPEGLTEIWSAGSAGMLVKRHVLDAIGDPWFTPAPNAVGLNEDIDFCRKVREAGFRIWCDPAAMLGHISHYTVWPRNDGELWQPDLVFDKRLRLEVNNRERAQVPA